MKSSKHRTSTIQREFILSVGVITFILLFGLGCLTFFVVRDYSVKNAFNLASLTVSETNALLESKFGELERLMRSLASYDEVRNGEKEKVEKLLYWNAHERSDLLRSIFLATKDGEMIISGFGEGFDRGVFEFPEGFDPRQTVWFKESFAGQSFSLSSLYQLDTLEALGMAALMPVFDYAKNPVGVLGAEMTIDKFQNLIAPIETLRGGKIMLIAQDGRVIASQFEREVQAKTLELFGSDIDEIGQILEEKNGNGVITMQGRKYFAAYQRNDRTGAIALAAFDYEEAMGGSRDTLGMIIAAFVILIAAVLATIVYRIRKTVKPIKPLMAAIGAMKEGNFDARASVGAVNEIGRLAQGFNSMATVLAERNHEHKLLGEDMEKKAREREAELQEKDAQMSRDMDMARRVKLAMMPGVEGFPEMEAIRFGALYSTMESLGGDMYDVTRIGENRLAFLMADVSGHGVPAAFIMAMAKLSFQRHSRLGTDPSRIVSRVNADMFRFIGDIEYYLTAFFCILDLEKRELLYTNAGHHAPILLRSRDFSIEQLDTQGYFIGSFEDGRYQNGSVLMEPGDRLLLFTDGIIESRNPQGQFYEFERLKEFVKGHSSQEATDFIDALSKDLDAFCEAAPQADDRAALYIAMTGKPIERLPKRPAAAGHVAESALPKEGGRKGLLEDESSRSAYQEAIRLLKEGDYAAAKGLLAKLSEDLPDEPRVLNSLGAACYKTGDFLLARKSLEKAIALDGSNQNAKKNLEMLERAEGRKSL